jgi:type IV secretory pathway TrbL component
VHNGARGKTGGFCRETRRNAAKPLQLASEPQKFASQIWLLGSCSKVLDAKNENQGTETGISAANLRQFAADSGCAKAGAAKQAEKVSAAGPSQAGFAAGFPRAVPARAKFASNSRGVEAPHGRFAAKSVPE